MKKNILVFPCGSEVGLDIYSSVCYSAYFHLIGGNSVQKHYDKFCDKHNGHRVCLHQVTKDIHGQYHDEYIYEILK